MVLVFVAHGKMMNTHQTAELEPRGAVRNKQAPNLCES
jgi:hypothetical protein